MPTLASTRAAHAFTDCSTGGGSTVFADIRIASGSSLLTHFPALGDTPEISDPNGPLHAGPLHVIALNGPVCSIPAYGPIPASDSSRERAGNVLRVIAADGDEWDFGYGDYATFVP